MKKKYFLIVGILILLIVGGYFGTQNFSNNVDSSIVEMKDSTVKLTDKKILSTDSIKKNDLSSKEKSDKYSSTDFLNDNLIHFDPKEALAKIEYIDNLGQEYFQKDVNKSFQIKNEKFLLKDHSEKLGYVVSKTDKHSHITEYGNNHESWNYYLTRPHPDVATLESYFFEASEEFKVPVQILKAIAIREGNWTMISPSIDQGWGFMHLTKNHYSNTLEEAATLLELPEEVLKKDAYHNIRGAAVLLAKYNNYNHIKFSKYSEWEDSLRKISGLSMEELKDSQVKKYYEIIYNGKVSKTLWDETIKIIPKGEIY